MRNAVKATVDAYDGETTDLHLRPIRPDHSGPTSSCFPNCCCRFSEMPADLRAHARYPETFFRVQAEVYRTFHMRDPQAFYNKEDLWDIARTVQGRRKPGAGGADLRRGQPARRGSRPEFSADDLVYAAE